MLRTPETRTAALTPAAFVEKWGPGGPAYRLTERSGAQSHFIDLCQVLEVDPPGSETYCFERGFKGIQGGPMFADVWKRGCFAWEYKKPGGDLAEALKQLMQYALPLENPPLLVVSDRLRIQIHTHFTGRPSERHELANEDLRDRQKLAILRSVFLEPDRFKPEKDSKALTSELAGSFAKIADALRKRGEAPFETAHFLTQCVFCCFAEDAGVLESPVFKQIVQARQDPAKLQKRLTTLFKTMRTGGDFGMEEIPWFNGGLFATVEVPLLNEQEIKVLAEAKAADWQAIDPSIFGTLFERGLDPAKRSQLGAHHTDAATIERLIDPVIRRPLLEEWDGIKRQIGGLTSSRDYMNVRAKGVPSKGAKLQARHAGIKAQASKANRRAKDLFDGFLERLKEFRVLDPACGSGNFLYLALKALKDVELQANVDAEELGLQRQFPVTGPHNVFGIEINEYAAELARATIWIGELQWLASHGYGWKTNPVLAPLDQIECRDAVLSTDGKLAEWPRADVVVGNPPFVGDKKMRGELGGEYTKALRAAFEGLVPGAADLVCYWFERARSQIEREALCRAGLVATNSIRQGVNRSVLRRVLATTRIFDAWPDEPWVNEGAKVRVSLIAFGKGDMPVRLAGQPVAEIHADLTAATQASAVDLTAARSLRENEGASYFGYCLAGPFTVDAATARQWLRTPNPNQRSNAAVLAPIWNGADIARRSADRWVIDFGAEMSEEEASLFEAPFAYVMGKVRPLRQANNRACRARWWWRHGETRPGLRRAAAGLERWIVTSETAKHRYFVWLPSGIVPEHKLVVFPRADDVTFGLLSSRLHVLWALRLGSTLEDRPVYTTSACFSPFPFPVGLAPADTAHQRTEAIEGGSLIPAALPTSLRRPAEALARAARRLVDLRDAWLNPSDWTGRVPEVVPLGMDHSPYPDRLVALPGFEKELAKRTLTNLYNQRPAWLVKAHEALDAAVALSYGWSDYTPKMSDDEILRRLLALNRQRAEEDRCAQRALPFDGAQVHVPADKFAKRKTAKRAEPAESNASSNRKVAR